MPQNSYLILSRAPLEYTAGIPRYCKTIYCSTTQSTIFLNYALDTNTKTHLTHAGRSIQYTCSSQFVVGTLAFSLDYIHLFFRLASKSSSIHYQSPDPLSAILILLLSLRKRLPILTTWHAEVYRSYLPLAPLLLIIDLLLYRRSSYIIFFTSAHFASSVFSRFAWFKRKAIISPFITTPAVTPKLSPLDRLKTRSDSRNHFRLISVGRLVPYKGYEYAIKAISLCRDLSIQYVIVGSGPLYYRLNALISSLDLFKSVALLTNVDDVQKYELLDSSAAFLFPSVSQSEAYGIVQLEAAHFSLPIINTQLCNGVNELFPPDVALTVPPKCEKSLARAIRQLYLDEQAYISRSTVVRRRLLNLYKGASNFSLSTLSSYESR